MTLLLLARVACLLLIIAHGSKVVQAIRKENLRSEYCVLSSRNDTSLCPPGVRKGELYELVSDGVFNQSYASFIFVPGNHSLSTQLVVENKVELFLEGQGNHLGDVTVVCTRKWSIGLLFTNVSDLSIWNIAFANCMKKFERLNAKSNGSVFIFSAVFYEGGENLNLSNVRFVNGALFINNARGDIALSEVHVNSHLYAKTTNGTTSIGGSFMNFSLENCSEVNLMISDSTFKFHHTENVSDSDPFNNTTVFVVNRLQALRVVLYCTMVKVHITRSNFSGFQGLGDGGNVVIILQNNNRFYEFPVVIEDCLFEGGHAIRGGGLYISLVQTYSKSTDASTSLAKAVNTSTPPKDAVILKKTTFVNNSADFAGAAVCIMQKESYTSDLILTVQFHNCNFVDNFLLKRGHGGIALYILQFVASKYLKHSRPQYSTTLCNCSMQRNYMKTKKSLNCSAGNGVITIIRNSLFMMINTDLISNNCTAILSVGSNLVLKGNLTISNNRGYSGGGLMFCEETVMFLKPLTRLLIANNRVDHAGGGICVESQCVQSKPMCFFQYSKEVYSNHSLTNTISIELVNNSAPEYAGDNLFGGFVDRCFILDSPTQNKAFIDGKSAFSSMFIVPLNGSSVTSIPMKVCFCNKNHVKNCSQKNYTIKVYPGQLFNVPVVIVGQLDGTVPGSVYAYTSSNEGVIDQPQKLQKVHYTTSCTNLKYTVISNNSEEDIGLYVDHDGDTSAYLHLQLFPPRHIYVTLKHCPIGFEKHCRDKTGYTCDCKRLITDLKEFAGTNCSIKDKKITVKPSTQGWIGYIRDPCNSTDHNKYVVVHTDCPYDYCRDNAVIDVSDTSLDQDSECWFNRTGTLCGGCSNNLSVILGTSACWECSNKSLTLILLFALMGVLLIVFLTVSNLTVSEGTIGGLIFYANVVQIGATFFFSPNTDKTALAIVLRVFISWINLDFGISACLYDGMDMYIKAWLQFVFPVYLWILSGLIVYLCNRYVLVTRVFGRNSVKVLSTVILLSFTKLLRAVTTTVSFVGLHISLPHTNVTRDLWLSDANVIFLQGKHIVLFLVGLIFGCLCGIFVLYLFCIQCLQPFRCIQRIKPFTDCYTGPNTSPARFWTGLLLLIRVVLLIAETIDSSRQAYVYPSVVIGVSVFLLFIGHLIPGGLYSQNKHNILESFFLLNLVILCLGHGHSTSTPDYHPIKWSGSATFLVFIGLLFYHFSQRLRKRRCCISLKNDFGRIVAPIAMGLVNHRKRKTIDSNVPVCNQDREPLLATVSYPSYQ